VLAALLLNRIVLRPGEAIYLPAGNPHAYLRGTGIEILANSDNVLRCGLTPKHVDVPELLRVLDFSYGQMPVQTGAEVASHHFVYPTPAAEFELSRLEWGSGSEQPVRIDHAGPQILICVDGAVTLRRADGVELPLRRGESAWLAAADPAVDVVPTGRPALVFRATAGINSSSN